MIDWLTASRYAAALIERPDRVTAAVAEAVGNAPRFQNTSFPVSPLPLFTDSVATAGIVPALEAYVELLEKIVRRYREEPEIRQWYALGPAAEKLIAADRRLGDAVTVCRLDGYLEQGSERLRLLENNADAPAGTLFSPRVNHLVRDMLVRAGLEPPAWSRLSFADETALLDVLLGCLSAAGADGSAAGDPQVAILQLAGRANHESHEMAELFRRSGIHAFVADPRQVRLADGKVRFGDRPADVCWNKVNTVAWRTAVESDPELVDRWAAVLSSGALVHVNSFAARYVAENKLALALPREPRFAQLFTEEERALADRLLPWARQLRKDAVGADGETPLLEHVQDHPAQYVIKVPYDIRGDGVTIGREASRAEWERSVAGALENRLIVQRYVPPAAYPVLRLGETPRVVAMPVSLDTYLFRGKVAGFGSKASLNARLNVFQGGQKLALHVVEPPPSQRIEAATSERQVTAAR
ncbi:MAG TPA: hypothetical protein VE465_26695 [Streptosporangiaceae bacterium]|jgi:hypothetical protein|nr:hypothetical protein [Streptosporangiaceae bacterium]